MIYRAAISVATDTALAKDRMIINPHFKDSTLPAGIGTEADDLAQDLLDGMKTYLKNPAYDIDVKMYNAEDEPTGPPKGHKRSGTTPVSSNGPRELAVCLSFFAGSNVKRRRGRVYIPHNWIYRQSTSPGPPTDRPSASDRTAVAALVPLFTGLGGPDVDWVVWSPTSHQAHSVTDWWVDDEWDIQRRRGGRPTARTSGTTSEAGFP